MDRATRLLSGAKSIGVVGGLAGAAALMLGPAARAELVLAVGAAGAHTAVSPGDTGTFRTVYLDLDGDANIDISVRGPIRSAFGAGTLTFSVLVTAPAVGDDYARRLTSTADILTPTGWDSVNTGKVEQIWRADVGQGWSAWSQGQGFLGIRIDNGPGYDYYWIQITPDTSSLPGTSYAINGWGAVGAYSASGGSPGSGGGPGGAVGTPEPATSGLALLALGAAGVLRKRRQRQVA